MPSVKEVRTLFTLEAKDFTQQVKNLDSLVDRVNANVKQSSKESLELSKELMNVKKALQEVVKQSDSLKNDKAFESISNDIKSTISDIDRANKTLISYRNTLREIKSDAASVQTSFDKGINLQSIGKFSTLVKDLKDTKVVDIDNLKAAQTSANRIADTLKDIEIDVDTTNLQNRLKSISLGLGSAGDLKHWVDNNGYSVSQSGDDSQRILREILETIKDIGIKVLNKTSSSDSYVDSSKLNENLTNNKTSTDKMAAAVNNLSEALKKNDVDMDKVVNDAIQFNKELDKTSEILKGFESRNSMNITGAFGTNPEKELEDLKKILTLQDDQKDNVNVIGAQYQALVAQVEEWNKALVKAEAEQARINSELQKAEVLSKSEDEKLAIQAQLKIQDKIVQSYKDMIKYSDERLKSDKAILDNAEKTNEEMTQQTSKYKQIISVVKKILDISGDGGLFNKAADVKENVSGLSEALKGLLGTSTQAAGGMSKAGAASAEAGAGASAAAGGATAAVAAFAAVAAVILVVIAAIKLFIAWLKQIVSWMKKSVNVAAEFQDQVAKFGATVRATQKQLDDFADSLANAFGNQGYTSNLEEYANTLKLIEQTLANIQEMNEAEKAEVADNVTMMSQVTGYDPKEIIRAQQRLMVNLKMSANDALDLIMGTYQKTGDLNNDLLDTFMEYSSQFQKLGYSADFFYNAIIVGSQAGVMNTDKVADTIKELWLRMSDGSDNVKLALNKVNLSYDSLMTEFNKGGTNAEQAFARVVTAISGIQDVATKQNVIRELFGAPGEDVGSAFFDALANAQTSVKEYQGSVEEAAAIMESSLGYQLTELKNQFTTLWDSIGEEILPIITAFVEDFKEHMDEIKLVVENYLVPAFANLAGSIGIAFDEDGATGFAQAIMVVILAISKLIDATTLVIAGIRAVWNVVSIVGKSITFVIMAIAGAIVGVCVSILDAIFSAVTAIVGVIEGLVRSFDDAIGVIGTFFMNLGIDIQNIFSDAFYYVQIAWNKFLDGLIWTYNHTIGLIPGVENMQYTNATVKKSENKERKKYNTGGFADAFGKDNVTFGFLEDYRKKADSIKQGIANVFNEVLGYTGDSISKDVDDLVESLKTVGNVFSGGAWYKEIQDKIDAMKKDGKLTSDKAKELEQTFNQLFNNTSGSEGQNKVGNNDTAKKLQDELEKARKERLDLIKRMIQSAKDSEKANREFEEIIFEQQLKSVDADSPESLIKQFDFIDQIKEKYILTADEMIAYTEKQHELAIKLRDTYADKLKESMKKELETFKSTKQKEYEAEKEANDKSIKALQKKIKAIDALMSQNEYNNTQEDYDREIAKLEAEYMKYQFATSYEGIQKRNEIEEELGEKRRQKQRSQQKNALEAEKKGYQDQIDILEEATETKRLQTEKAIKEEEAAYEKMYAELETMFEDKENLIQNIRNRILIEKNAEMKAEMEQFVKDYEDALARMEQSTLTMKQMQNWRIEDDKRAYEEGKLTGDSEAMQEAQWDANNARDNGGTTKGSSGAKESYVDPGSTEYQHFKSLQAKYDELEKKKKKKGTTAKNKEKYEKEQKEIKKELDALRKKYGVKKTEDIPKWPPKFHTGGVVKDYMANAQGEVNALLQPGEVVFTEKQFGNMVDAFDKILNYNNVGSTFSSAPSSVVNNYYGAMVNIENVNNNTNADFRKMSNELDVWANRRARAYGTRRI